MKHFLPTFCILILSIFSFISRGQNVNVSVWLSTVERSSSLGDGCCYGCPDPTWITWASANGSANSFYQVTWCRYQESMCGTTWTPSTPLLFQHLNSTATTITLALDAWENDCVVDEDVCGYNTHWYCPDGDGDRCTNYGVASINFRNDPPCVQKEYWTNWCGYYRYKVIIEWSYAEPPVVTTHPNPNNASCIGGTNIVLSTAASGGRFFQWQYSTSSDCSAPGTWTDIDASYNGGNPGTGYTSATYTPPQISGTRLYRAKITSNCTASFSSNVSYSNCARVTYNPIASPPPIQSSVCGQTVLPGSIHVFSTVQPPAVGAAANLTSPFYTWVATGGSPTSGSGPTFTWAAPSAQGSYTITLTYKSSCGDVSPAACTVTVGPPPCGKYAYVSPTGTANTTCDPLNPCPSVSYVVNNLAVLGNPNYIRVSTGTINEPGFINLVSGLTIEGKYLVSNGVWSKTNSTTAVTTLNFSSGGSVEFISSVCHRVGFKSFSANNWTLMDLNITTDAVNGIDANFRGCSNYGVLISNSSGYKITRCNITSGPAAAGMSGDAYATPRTGHSGASGTQGQAGGSGGQFFFGGCDYDGGISGGFGGSGNSNPWGNNGAAGGAGGGSCGHQCGNPGSPGSSAPGGGSGGSGAPGRTTGGNCNEGDGYDAPNNAGGYDRFTANTAGINGGTASPSHSFGTYFVPSGQGAQGGHGRPGGGGGGGGGSAGQDGCSICFCNSNTGNGGGGGGQGGGGGEGGYGGFGGGGSFPIYQTSATGTLSDVYLVNGISGPGGPGGAGGLGGVGGAGGPRQGSCSSERGTAGAGAPGGSGARGGTGQTGATGISEKMFSNGSLLSNPPGSISSPFNPGNPITLYAQSQDYCRNSDIQLGKTTGTWTFQAGLNIVNDKRDAPAGTASSSYTTSSNLISAYTTSANATYDVTVGSTFYDDILKIGSSLRILPIINSPTTLCYQGTLALSATTWGTVVEHEWRIYPGDDVNNPVFTSTVASPTTPPLTCGTYPCTYTIRYRQREQCCGWSVPVFSTVTILPEFTRGTVNNTGKTICKNTQGDVNIGFSTPPAGSGGFTYQWYWKEGIDCPVAGSTTGWTTIGTNSPTLTAAQVNSLGNLDTAVTFACWVAPTSAPPVCGTANWASQCFTITVLPDFDPGAVQRLSETFCAGGNPAPVELFPPPQGSGFTYQWYYYGGNNSNPPSSWPLSDPGCPSGTNSNVSGWKAITGATGTSYDPPSIDLHTDSLYTTPNDIYYGFAVFVTPTASGNMPACGTAQWADSCRIVRETDGNFYVNNLNANYGNADRSTNVWTATVCYGYNSGCSGAGCFTLDVRPISGGGPVNNYRVKWERSYDFNTWTTLQVDSPATGTTYYRITDGFYQPTYFRALILPVDPACGNEQLANNYWLINVLEPFDAGEITGDVSATQCYGYNPPPLTANPVGIFPDGYLNSSNIYTDYKWERSTDGGASWTVVSPYPQNAVLGTPTIVNEAVTSIPVISGGSGYTVSPTVYITDNNNGSGATATVSVNSSNAITGVTITNGGNYYATGTTVKFTDNTIGSGASATVNGLNPADSSITGITLNANGTGYTQAGTVVRINNTGFNPPRIAATATATVSNGQVTAITITNYGAGYESVPNVQIIDTTTGRGATGTVTVSNGQVTGVTITNGGTGYTTATTVTFTDNTVASGASATANIANGAVTSITINSGGTGYTSGTTVRLGTENHSYNKTYDYPDNLTDTTWFRYWVRPTGFSSLDCYGSPIFADDVAGDTIMYNILPQVNPGTIAGFTPDVKPQCLNYDPPLLYLNPTPTGALGLYNYMWQTSNNQTTWNQVPLINAPEYNPGPLTDTTYFRVVVDPIGSPDCPSATSSVMEIKVGPSLPAYAGEDATICSDSYTFSANKPDSLGSLGGLGTWTVVLGGTGGGSFSNVHNANATYSGLSRLLPNNLNRFKWEIVSDLCVTTSDIVDIISDAEPDNANAGLDQTVCDTNAVLLDGNSLTVPGAYGTWSRFSGSGDIVSPNNPDTWVNNLISGMSRFMWTTSNGVCADKSDIVNVFTSIPPYMTWTGAVSTDWNDPANWGCGNIPGKDNKIIIPLVGNLPVVNRGNVGICDSIGINVAASLTVNNKAKFGVKKPFVWANAGPDVTVCSNAPAFQIGGQYVTGQDDYTTYQWTCNNPVDYTVLMNDPNDPEPIIDLRDTVTAIFIEFVLTATHNTDPDPENFDTDTMRIIVNPAPPAFTGPDQTYCIDSVQLGISSTGNIYSWTPSAGLSATNVANPKAAPSATTTYYFTETNPVTLCTRTNDVTVTVSTAPTASVSSTPTQVCSGGSVTLTFNMTGTGPTWDVIYTTNGSNPDTLSNISDGYTKVRGPLTANTTFQITSVHDDGTGCTNPTGGSATVTVNPSPSVSISEEDDSGVADDDAITCSGDEAILTASASSGTSPYSYAWNQGLGTGSVKAVYPTATTTYAVTVTDNAGCTGTASKTITVNSNPTVTTSPEVTTVCSGTSVTITSSASGGTSPYTYLWSPGNGATPDTTVSPSSSTAYTLIITDANACSATDVSQVNINSSPTVSITPANPVICTGGSATLVASGSGGTGAGTYIYSWSHGLGTGSTKIVSPAATTTYSVTVTDNNNCTGTNSKTVTVNSSPSVSITASESSGNNSNDDETCSGAQVDLAASGSGGSGPGTYTYSWSHSLGSGANKTVYPTISTTMPYRVTVTDANSCTGTASKTITVNQNPTAGINVDESSGTADDDSRICSGYGATTLQSAPSGGQSPYTYAWSPNIGSGAGPHTIAPSSTTTYNHTVTDAKLCSGTTSVTITVDPLPDPPSSWVETYSTACTGSNAVRYVVSGAGGKFNWSFSDGCIQCVGSGCSTQNDSVLLDFTACGTGSYTISVTETNPATNCTSASALTQAVNVVSGSPPNISGQPASKTICAGTYAGFKVAASGTGLSYKWQYSTNGGSNWADITTGSISGHPTYAGYASDTLTAGNNTTDSHSGYQYRCVVSGTCPPSQTSNAATLTVNTAPSITTQPSSQSKCTGENVTFSVTASGIPSPSYQWRKNGSNISGATSSSYTISSVASGDAGNYDVVVSNSCGSVTSNTATLTVYTAPSVSGASISVKVICSSNNKTTRLTLSGGSLGSDPSANWKWYSSGCGSGSSVGTGTYIDVSSSGTYYVRGESTTCGNSSCISLSVTAFTGTYYADANALYWDQRSTHYDVEFGGSCGSGTVYSWNSYRKVYINGKDVLIPSITSTSSSPITKDTTAFYGWPDADGDDPNGPGGYSIGTPNHADWQYDARLNTCANCTSSTALEFNKKNIFISPASTTAQYSGGPTTMTYCRAMEENTTLGCSGATTSCITIDGNDATLAYPSWNPKSGLRNVNTASSSTCTNGTTTSMELINIGVPLNGTNNDYVSQQQLDPVTPDPTYCVKAYGKGWRLPTDVEVGHTNDNTGTGQGFDNAYRGATTLTTTTRIWTSSQNNTTTSNRWSVRIDNTSLGNWSGANVLSGTYVRCVFDGGY
ncbi:MAG TPA: immunoglobulin domain-containing protein [Chitinophagales bacterium]|nr:immunoglobulin domain-containing protein [Chitinophagales bacterium]